MIEVNGFGVLPYRMTENGPEYLILKYQTVNNGRRNWGGFWGIPLGLIEKDEEKSVKKLLQEHVGVKPKSVQKLEEAEDYTTVIKGNKLRKKVNYFLVELKSDADINVMKNKYETSTWFAHRTAWNKITTPTVKKVLNEAHQKLTNQ